MPFPQHPQTQMAFFPQQVLNSMNFLKPPFPFNLFYEARMQYIHLLIHWKKTIARVIGNWKDRREMNWFLIQKEPVS